MPKQSFRDPNEPLITKRQFGIVLRSLYPHSTTEQRGRMLRRFMRQQYRGRLLTIAAMAVDNWVRHKLTEYERLVYASDDADARAKARQAVASEVATIIASWQQGSALQNPAYQAMRNELHEVRLREGPSPELTRAENIAIVDELARWLEGHGEAVAQLREPRWPETRSTHDHVVAQVPDDP